MRIFVPASLLLFACHFDTSTVAGLDDDPAPPGANPSEVDGSVAAPDGPPLTPGSPDAGPPLCYESSGPASSNANSNGGEGCITWPSIDDLDSDVTITRSGTTISIDFGSGIVFSGTVVNGVVEVIYTRQFPDPENDADGCTWQADEALTGTLRESDCQLSLAYDYREFVAVSDGFCNGACDYPGSTSVVITAGASD